jgi:hypothetical protein
MAPIATIGRLRNPRCLLFTLNSLRFPTQVLMSICSSPDSPQLIAAQRSVASCRTASHKRIKPSCKDRTEGFITNSLAIAWILSYTPLDSAQS